MGFPIFELYRKLLVMEGGSVVYYDFQAQGRSISVQRCTLYWENSEPKAGYYEAFTAEKWCYTENGYFFFGQYRMPGDDGSAQGDRHPR